MERPTIKQKAKDLREIASLVEHGPELTYDIALTLLKKYSHTEEVAPKLNNWVDWAKDPQTIKRHITKWASPAFLSAPQDFIDGRGKSFNGVASNIFPYSTRLESEGVAMSILNNYQIEKSPRLSIPETKYVFNEVNRKITYVETGKQIVSPELAMLVRQAPTGIVSWTKKELKQHEPQLKNTPLGFCLDTCWGITPKDGLLFFPRSLKQALYLIGQSRSIAYVAGLLAAIQEQSGTKWYPHKERFESTGIRTMRGGYRFVLYGGHYKPVLALAVTSHVGSLVLTRSLFSDQLPEAFQEHIDHVTKGADHVLEFYASEYNSF